MTDTRSGWAFDRHTWGGIVRDRNLWFCTIAMTLVLLLTTVLNHTVFPYYDTVYAGTRDISVFSSSLACAVMALVATWRPRWLVARTVNAILAILLLSGFALSIYGVNSCSLLWTAVGASAFSIGRIWISVVVGMAASSLPPRRMTFCIAISFLLMALLGNVVAALPQAPGLVLYFALPVMSYLLVYRIAAPVVEAQRTSDAPGDLAITRPASFVPLAGQLFICLFIFKVAFGYSLRFGSLDGTPLTNIVSAVPILLIAAWLLTHDKPFPADTLTRVSVLFVVAGFLSVTLVAQGYEMLSTTIISCGSQIFEMVGWVVLIAIGSKNRLGAIPAIAWGRGINGIGTIVGAFLGNYVNGIFGQNTIMVFLVTSTMILVFVTYALFGLRRFSFDATIEGIAPTEQEPTAIASPSDAERFDDSCARVADAHGLTPRELEVFKMLARGRNSVYIQDELVVSRNTVKAHVKHIYVKLGIHSHQDLIDIVENAERKSA